MVENNVRNLCALSESARMLAIDDGRHNPYAKNGGQAFPCFKPQRSAKTALSKAGRTATARFLAGDSLDLCGVIGDGGTQVRIEWSGAQSRGPGEIVAHAFTVNAP
jgi:hypothetical protein